MKLKSLRIFRCLYLSLISSLQVSKHYAPAAAVAAAPIHYDYDDGYYNQAQYEYVPQYDAGHYGHYASPYATHY